MLKEIFSSEAGNLLSCTVCDISPNWIRSCDLQRAVITANCHPFRLGGALTIERHLGIYD
jgi:hypothetical protein